MLEDEIADWRAASARRGRRDPEVSLNLLSMPGSRWRLVVFIDGEIVFQGDSSYRGKLYDQARAAFRQWVDGRDRLENEARLEASLTEGPAFR